MVICLSDGPHWVRQAFYSAIHHETRLQTKTARLFAARPVPNSGRNSPAPTLDESGGNRLLKTFDQPKGV
jgi:hypothetical protein